MDELDIEKILSESQKRVAREAIKTWVNQEIHGEVRRVANGLAQKWIKNNGKELEIMFNEEFKKVVPTLISTLINKFKYM